MNPSPAVVALLSLTVALATAGEAPILSNTEAETGLFTVPAPRGLIVDRNGEALALNEVHQKTSLRLAAVEANSLEQAVLEVRESHPDLAVSITSDLTSHWENRRLIPYELGVDDLPPADSKLLTSTSEYRRKYPHQNAGSHLLGYISRETPKLDGPVHSQEPLWPLMKGRAGVEQAFDNQLRGQDGMVSLVFNEEGFITHRQIVEPATPGKTVVLSISLPMQKLAEQLLAEGGRPGALVAMDAATGDVLAAASFPDYNPNEFVPAISQERYQALSNQADSPFYARAWAGQYPPGSIFKPIVALGALKSNDISGLNTICPCPTSYEIAGREFRNWSDKNEGMMDVRAALMRSCNTWFFQVAEKSGAEPFITAAHDFGLGTSPVFPLEGTAAGRVPTVAGNGIQAAANLSIGQGDLLVSPLQMAVAMSGIANGNYIPQPRLVLQIQEPPPSQSVQMAFPTARKELVGYTGSDLLRVRQGMWGVVNHPNGTGTAAKTEWPQVLGKTGTAQWSKGGSQRPLVWFAGYVNSRAPQIAFVVMLEGDADEQIFGGSTAAPVIGKFLRTVYADPQQYGVDLPSQGAFAADGPFRGSPTIIQPAAQPEPIQRGQLFRPINEGNSYGQRDEPSGRNLFRRMFGR